MMTDWELKLEIACKNYRMARQIELYIKKMKSRKFIEKLIFDPAEVERLKNLF